jgi:hypothetical protein
VEKPLKTMLSPRCSNVTAWFVSVTLCEHCAIPKRPCIDLLVFECIFSVVFSLFQLKVVQILDFSSKNLLSICNICYSSIIPFHFEPI